jgi:hypothetical protein
MSDSTPNFIRVKRVLSDKDSSVNTKIEDESININDIQGYRAWHKGPNDDKIVGPMTMVVKKSDSKNKTILIQEDYDKFEKRLQGDHGVTVK